MRCGTVLVMLLAGCASRPGPAPAVDPERVPLVYGGGASVSATFRVSPEHMEELRGLMEAGTDPALERRAMGQAIGLMERIAGEQTITWMDKRVNEDNGRRGQLDCVDESTNTTTYLHLLEQRGWLRWHRVLRPVWRAPYLVDTHRTAVVEDTTDGSRYVVDSWFRDNGEPAQVQPLEDWRRRKPFPVQ